MIMKQTKASEKEVHHTVFPFQKFLHLKQCLRPHYSSIDTDQMDKKVQELVFT